VLVPVGLLDVRLGDGLGAGEGREGQDGKDQHHEELGELHLGGFKVVWRGRGACAGRKGGKRGVRVSFGIFKRARRPPLAPQSLDSRRLQIHVASWLRRRTAVCWRGVTKVWKIPARIELPEK